MNFRKIPGTTYPIGEDFGWIPMSQDSPYAVPWWYRTEFKLDPAGRHVQLQFDGISFSANIWLNGKRIAARDQVAGTFRSYSFDITSEIRAGEPNALAVEVFAPTPSDLASTWIDWNPAPADKNMGIWREAKLKLSGPVTILSPQIITHLDSKNARDAHLTLQLEVQNLSPEPNLALLEGQIEGLGIRFNKLIWLEPSALQSVRIDESELKSLRVRNAPLWWPNGMGEQALHTLKLELKVGGTVSDSFRQQVGFREITSQLTRWGTRLFYVNGLPLLIRGGGWAPDIFLRATDQRMEDEFRLVRDLGLNTIRFEGKFETEKVLQLADRYGILIMAGWPCCSHWEEGDWSHADYEIARQSARAQILALRGHPSSLVWLNGSDTIPNEEVESIYMSELKRLSWSNPILGGAKQGESTLTGPTGVKMNGPYDYVPPNYWLVDENFGGAFGFNTETSPGPSIPPIEGLRKIFPNGVRVGSDEWNYHTGCGGFGNTDHFTHAVNARYGGYASLEEYASKAQVLAYDGHRAMFEAFARNKYQPATGVIQWMLNNAWPSLIWHLYDYELRPGGAYFGVKKANEPIHVLYSYPDRTVFLVNNELGPKNSLQVTARVLDFDLRERFSRTITLDAPSDSAVPAISLPEIPALSTTYFVVLQAKDTEGNVVSDNFYWLSTQIEKYLWSQTTIINTPIERDGDLTRLNSLKPARVSAQVHAANRAGTKLRVSLSNTGSSLAFFVRAKLVDAGTGQEILPVFWQDNYISLLPGESRELSVRFDARALRSMKSAPAIEIDGWNVIPDRIDAQL